MVKVGGTAELGVVGEVLFCSTGLSVLFCVVTGVASVALLELVVSLAPGPGVVSDPELVPFVVLSAALDSVVLELSADWLAGGGAHLKLC